jgi:hypothetical protein
MTWYDVMECHSMSWVISELGVKHPDRKTCSIETAQEWLGNTSTAHTRAYIDAEDYQEKANGVVAGLDI